MRPRVRPVPAVCRPAGRRRVSWCPDLPLQGLSASGQGRRLVVEGLSFPWAQATGWWPGHPRQDVWGTLSSGSSGWCAGVGGRWLGLPVVPSWLWGWTRVHAAPIALGSRGGRSCDRPGATSSPTPCSAADPSPGGPALEERVAQEALEALQLEKRLSLLSHSGRPGSGGRAVTWLWAALGLAPPL